MQSGQINITYNIMNRATMQIENALNTIKWCAINQV